MEKILIGTKRVECNDGGCDQYYCDEWWRPNGYGLLEVFSDGTTVTYPEFENEEKEKRYLNGFTVKKESLEVRLV